MAQKEENGCWAAFTKCCVFFEDKLGLDVPLEEPDVIKWEDEDGLLLPISFPCIACTEESDSDFFRDKQQLLLEVFSGGVTIQSDRSGLVERLEKVTLNHRRKSNTSVVTLRFWSFTKDIKLWKYANSIFTFEISDHGKYAFTMKNPQAALDLEKALRLHITQCMREKELDEMPLSSAEARLEEEKDAQKIEDEKDAQKIEEENIKKDQEVASIEDAEDKTAEDINVI